MSNEFVRLVASDIDVIAFFECFIVFKEHKGKLLSLSVIAQAEPGVSVISSKPQKWHEMCRQKHESGTKCATFFIRHSRPCIT